MASPRSSVFAALPSLPSLSSLPPVPSFSSLTTASPTNLVVISFAAGGIVGITVAAVARRLLRARRSAAASAAAASLSLLEPLDPASFGHSIRSTCFSLDPHAVFLNHASYGTVPRPIREKRQELLERCEHHPDHWFRRTKFDAWRTSAECAARWLGTDTLAFVDNATTAVQAVLNSVPFEAGDAILITSLAYGAVRRACEEVVARRGLQLLVCEIAFPLPADHEETYIVEQVRRSLETARKSGIRIRLSIVDHLSSPTAIRMPIAPIIHLCRGAGSLVFIDGAHAPGQLEVQLDSIDADFYTGNFHKWCFAPRGCAFIWARRGPTRDLLQTPIVSWFRDHPWPDRFMIQGTRDETPYFCLPDSLIFYEYALGGLEAIHRYNSQLIQWAAPMLATRWSTALLAPLKLCAFMAVIRLPLSDVYDASVETNGEEPMKDLFHMYNIQCATFVLDGQFWVRISAQVYNDRDDYLRLANAVLDLRERRLRERRRSSRSSLF